MSLTTPRSFCGLSEKALLLLQERDAFFAAKFALSHACWLVTYPLPEWLGSSAGIPLTLLVLNTLTLAGVAIALADWPAHDREFLAHEHRDLPANHPHLPSA